MTPMPFDSLPHQTPINARADIYGVTALALSRAVAKESRCELDVAYGSDYWQKIDIYLPAQTGLTGLPVFLCIHGGGWSHGYKEWMGFQAPPIVSLPAIYVSVSYRLAPAVTFPAPLDDCLDALAWVYRNIRQHGGDPNRIFIGGHSAGAHLSALATLRRDLFAVRGLPPDVIKACFPFSGIYSFDLDECAPSGAKLLAGVADHKPANPLDHVAGNRTPFFLTWATNERPYIIKSSERFAAALRQQPGRFETHLFEDFDHFYIHLDMQRADNLWVRTLRAWMAGDPATARAAA
jgi:arylformamidase